MLLLVTGVSGLLGSNLARTAGSRGYELVGTYWRHPVAIDKTECLQLDLATPEHVATLVGDIRPEVVVHTAAMSHPDDCAPNRRRCRLVNVESTRLLARAAVRVGARFLFLSSDLVYGTSLGELTEDVPVQPAGVYAASKVAAEGAALEETNGRAFVARTSLICGWGTGATRCTFEEWLAALRTGQRIRAFTDQRRCPTYVADLVGALLTAAEQGLSGVYNVAGPELCTRFEYACAMAREFDLDESLIEPFSVDRFDYQDPRPKELNLSIRKLRAAIGYEPLGVAETLRTLHESEGLC